MQHAPQPVCRPQLRVRLRGWPPLRRHRGCRGQGHPEPGRLHHAKHFAGNDLELSFGLVLPSTDESTTNTAYGHQVLRNACHNILYMTANSNALATATPGPYPVEIAIYALGFVPIALFVLFLFRRHRKMKAWKAQQAV